jgi:hypothetical protein
VVLVVGRVARAAVPASLNRSKENPAGAVALSSTLPTGPFALARA